ncbi:unnamed protein product, partial [Brenthis ino]
MYNHPGKARSSKTIHTRRKRKSAVLTDTPEKDSLKKEYEEKLAKTKKTCDKNKRKGKGKGKGKGKSSKMSEEGKDKERHIRGVVVYVIKDFFCQVQLQVFASLDYIVRSSPKMRSRTR